MLISSYSDQIKELLLGSQKVLIATKKNPDLDVLTAGFVLERNLRRLDKKTTLLIEEFNVEALPSYFDGFDVQTKLPPKSLIVSINLQNSPIEKVNYQTIDGRLDLIITPKSGDISAEAIEFKESDLDFDLVFVLGAKNLDETGSITAEHSEALAKKPLVNFDINHDNSLFGKLNLIDEESVGLSSAIFIFGKSLGFNYDKIEATALYFALVDKTVGFSQNVSVSVFREAADLLELGAKVEERAVPIRESVKEEIEMR